MDYRLVQLGPIGNLSSSEVALKFIAAPINPADINLVSIIILFLLLLLSSI